MPPTQLNVKMRVLQITGLVLLWVWTGVQVATAACSDQVSSGDKGVGISADAAPTCPTAGGVGCFGGNIACRFCMAFSTPQSSHFLPCATTTTTTTTTPTVAPTAAPTSRPTAAPSSMNTSDPLQFRAQMLLHDDESHEAPTTNHVLVGVSDAAYVTQLAVILCAWHSIGSNPLQSLEESTEAIEGVTPAFSSRQRVLGVSVDKIHEFVRTIEEGDALTVTTELIDELGGARGILTLLGFQQTVGSRDLAPLTFRQCLAAFTERHTRDEPLTVGARAFSKHCARSSSGWWGEMMGNDAAKNARAEIKVRELLASATWKNIHSLPHAHATMEIRNALGYGARWDAESGTFRGFLEPPMLHGHEINAFIMVLTALTTGSSTVSAASCADRVSSGDQSVGITAFEDPSCVSGGLGCFPYGDPCRFCKKKDSTVEHLELCPESPQTESPPATTEPPEESSIDCKSLVSVGDQGVGISAVGAITLTCASNGLGCFHSGQCRFCQTESTTQSAPFLKCSDLLDESSTIPPRTPTPTSASTSTTCASVVSRSGLVGISYVSESRCNVASPTLLGCSPRTSCRLCRNYKNEANQYLVSCKVLRDQGATESGAVDSTTESTTADKNAGELTVTTAAAGAGVATASSAGGAVAAVAAVVAVLVVVMMSVMYVKGRRAYDEPMTPEDCPEGGLLTPHGGHGYTPREGSLVMVVSQSSIATLTRMTRIVPVVWATMTCFSIMTAAQTISCASRVSVGDQGVGISAIEDPSCNFGGLGCFPDGICRFCQTWATPQSSHLVTCQTPQPSATATISPSPPVSTSATPTDCDTIVRMSSFTGISFVTDETCNVVQPSTTGCAALTTCRLCRTVKNEDNQFLTNCAAFGAPASGSLRRLKSENGELKNFTGIALSCVGGMALVVAIIGLAHSRFCHRNEKQETRAVDDNGFGN
ncbi:hypothetical protein P3T76_003846 [Phytophthora citrophthora]|uniref:Membrane-associated protein n=1 Tax=Phytophthora citrophthora TaxID=4793 RepID=A0AAD9GW61_9STRA|nr:hypothetical protein P3T76_003846 [Phytophthora citrophthora]